MALIYSPFFEHWWEGYPRKESKADAFKAWCDLGLDNHRMAKLLKFAIKIQRIDWSRHPSRPKDKMPYPATWLRSGKWKDYINPDGTPDEQRGERKSKTYWFGGEEHDGT
jgi:hypothetical protein